MKTTWKDVLSCAIECSRCHHKLEPTAPRLLSVYDHQAVCTVCKKEEETRPDYEETFKNTIGQCLEDAEILQGDPGGYCYHHFYPYTC